MRFLGVFFCLLALAAIRLSAWVSAREAQERQCTMLDEKERAVHCPYPVRNPGESLPPRFQPRPSSGGNAVAARFLDRTFGEFPRLLEFERGIWLGQWENRDSDIYRLYRAGGLLHVLALSGQHVAVLCALCLWFFNRSLSMFSNPLLKRLMPFVPSLRRTLPVAAALFLVVTSAGAPSMLRAFACIASGRVLEMFRLSASGLQRLCTSCALLILLDPALIASKGFVLSAIATAWVGKDVFLFANSGGVGGYLRLSLKMSLCAMPLSAFYFGRVALLSPVLDVLIAWFWELVLLPAGFLAPVVFVVCPGPTQDFLGNGFEAAWQKFESAHRVFLPVVETFSVMVPSLNWAELALLELSLFHCFFVNKTFK